MGGHRIPGWIATLLLWLPASALPAESLVFVPLPMENPRSTVAHSQALGQALAAFRESDGEVRYTCALAAPAEHSAGLGTHTVEQPPVQIALTQPMSTCGYLASAWLLQQAGADIDAARMSYLGSHEAVALALVRGEYPLGGLRRTIAERYAQLGIRVISETEPLPGFVLSADFGF